MSKRVAEKRSAVAKEQLPGAQDSQINKLMRATPKYDLQQQLSRARESPVPTNLINATKNDDCKRQKIELIYDHVSGDVHKHGGRSASRSKDQVQLV